MMTSTGWSPGKFDHDIDRSLSSSYMHQKKTPPWLSLDHGLPSSRPTDDLYPAQLESPFSSASSSSYSSSGPLDYSPPLSTPFSSSPCSGTSYFAGQQALASQIAQHQAQVQLQVQAQQLAQLQAAAQAKQPSLPNASFDPPSAQLQQLLDLAGLIAAQYKNVVSCQHNEDQSNQWSHQNQVDNEAEVTLALLAASLREAEEKPKSESFDLSCMHLLTIHPKHRLFQSSERSTRLRCVVAGKNKDSVDMGSEWILESIVSPSLIMLSIVYRVCQFAHGRDELRSVSRHPKYKTEVSSFSLPSYIGSRC